MCDGAFNEMIHIQQMDVSGEGETRTTQKQLVGRILEEMALGRLSAPPQRERERQKLCYKLEETDLDRTSVTLTCCMACFIQCLWSTEAYSDHEFHTTVDKSRKPSQTYETGSFQVLSLSGPRVSLSYVQVAGTYWNIQ